MIKENNCQFFLLFGVSRSVPLNVNGIISQPLGETFNSRSLLRVRGDGCGTFASRVCPAPSELRRPAACLPREVCLPLSGQAARGPRSLLPPSSHRFPAGAFASERIPDFCSNVLSSSTQTKDRNRINSTVQKVTMK